MAVPDLIVGVDFGMTYTGVAYASPSTARQTPRVIQRWPGRSHRDENKVPTRLVYNFDRSREREASLSSWGFQCNDAETNDPNKKLRDWFKLLVQSEHLIQKNRKLAEAGYPITSEADVNKWLEEYLSNIYRQTEQEISRRYKRTFWETSSVVFIFSLPTTWNSHEMIERKFKNAILRAGFGSVGPNHTVELGLTEAEAAAVYTADAGQLYQLGEVILVCDAGGGTTDASVHKISSIMDRNVELDALLTVQGVTVGSTEIDRQFSDLAQQRLQSHGFSKNEAEDLARTMMEGEEFQSNKCLFGDPDSHDPIEYELRIPELESETPRRSSRNQYRELRISRAEMKGFFDSQINQILNLIDTLLDKLQRSHSSEVSKIVLSGGLGSSHYVRNQLASQYSNINGQHPNATRIDIILADEPQLAVVKGLVINRLQRISRGRSVLQSRCCRASYGIVCDTLWNKHAHIDQIPVKNPFDKKFYATNQISWLVRQGTTLSEDQPIEHTFFRRIEPHKIRTPWTDKIASSKVPLHLLPSRADDRYIHCRIQSDLTHIPLHEFKKENSHFWSRGKRCYRVNYQVKVIIDPAHIRFELWHNGKNYTKNHPIAVEWGEAAMEISDSPAVYAPP